MQQFLDRFGKAAQLKATETKIRWDIRGFNSKLDERAHGLGHLVFRKHQGETIADEDFDKILAEMSQLVAERKAKEAELEAIREQAAAPAPASPPAAEEGSRGACRAGAPGSHVPRTRPRPRWPMPRRRMRRDSLARGPGPAAEGLGRS